jgi:hypothetical protein
LTTKDLLLEEFLQQASERKVAKGETASYFDRDVFMYDRDGVRRQASDAIVGRVTYEDHRKAVSTATMLLREDTQHGITMAILTHRFFTDYRNKVFKGEGDFYSDYSYLLVKVATLFNAKKASITPTRIPKELERYTEPTLVQVNHITGTTSEVNVPFGLTLSEWAQTMNVGAPESTTYGVYGLKLTA